MAEPLDTSAIQQKMDALTKWIWQKETDVDTTDAATNSFINNSSRSWSTDLPPLVVEKIYLLLNRQDQSRMSMVCKNWAKEYKSPSIWRDFTFVIPSENYSSDVCPEVRRAQTFGELFHHVKILKSRIFYQHKKARDQLLLFLDALMCRSQLLSFHIEINFFKLNELEVHDNIFPSFLRFIQSQNNMKIIKFINTNIDDSKYVQILEELIIKKPATLKEIHLIGVDMFCSGDTPDFPQNTRGLYDMLLIVEQLFIDYSQLFERIIFCLKDAIECDKLPLRQKPIYIHLYSDCTKDFFQGIESITWKILSKHWPTLKVGLYYTVSGFMLFDFLNFTSFEKLIVKNMPLTTFECDLGLEEEPHINDVFRHLTLTEVCNFLEVIKITSKETNRYVQDLITLLLLCPNLEQFTARVPLRVKSLDLLFDFIAANHIKNLKYFCVKLLGTDSRVDLKLYKRVIEKYSINMQEMGFKITCKCCCGMEICKQIYHISLDITCWKESVKS